LARKQLGKALQGTHPQEPPDLMHNLGTPNCRILAEAVADIIPEASDTPRKEEEEDGPSILGKLVRLHFQQTTTLTTPPPPTGVSAASTTGATASKKKKKRKKKKKTGDITATTEESAPQQEVEKSCSNEDESAPPQQPPPPPPAPLEDTPPSTLATDILRQWLQQESSSEELPENRNLTAFLEHIAKLSIELDYNVARDAVEAIACDACKQVAASHFWRQCGSIVLAPSHMALPKQDSSSLTVLGGVEEFDRAFDYVAMEEGEASSDTILAFDHEANEQYIKCNQTLALEQLEIIIRDMILIHGLSEKKEILQDDNVQSRIPEKEVNRIIKEAQEGEENLKIYFENLEQKHSTLLAQLEDSCLVSQFDIKASSLFMESDENLDTALNSLISLVRNVSEQHYRSSFRKDAELSRDVEEMYSWIAETISTILQAQLSHSARILQLSSRPGSVPQLAVNAQHRDSFRTLLMTKLTVLQELRRQLASIMLDRHLCRKVWSNLHMDEYSFEKVPVAPDSDGLDDFWNVTEQMTHNIRCGNVADLKKHQVERTAEWVKEIVSFQAKKSPKTKLPAHLMESYERQLPEVMRLSKIAESTDDEDAREQAIPQYATTAFSLFRNVLNQMLYLQRETASFEYGGAVIVPLKLKSFLRGENLGLSGPCEGGGGRRRTTGILVGLFYRWLKERCDEWNAELTQNELLESMVDETFEDFKPAKGKKSKKKRDKEKKNALAVAQESESVPPPNKLWGVFSVAVDESAGKALDASNKTIDESTEKLAAPARSGRESEMESSVAAVPASESGVVPVKPLDASSDIGDKTTNDKLNISIDTTDESIAELVAAIDNAHREKEAEKWETVDKRSKKAVVPSNSDSVGRGSNVADKKDTVVDKRTEKPDISADTVERGTSLLDSSRAFIENSKKHETARDTVDRVSKAAETSKENTDRGRSVPKPENGEAKEKKQQPTTTTKPAKTLSPASKSLAQKTPRSGTHASKTPDRGTKDNGPRFQVDSKKPASPRRRAVVPLPSVDVGVVSSTGFQSAEGFLVQRLMEAMQAEGRKKSSN